MLVPGGPGQPQAATDYSHLGFALDSRTAVDAIADKARATGYLVWEPREEPYPVGYYCGIRAPDGNMVEFSYGQPLGPGAKEQWITELREASVKQASEDDRALALILLKRWVGGRRD